MSLSRSLMLVALLSVQFSAWSAPGDLDSTFGTSGRARIPMPANAMLQAATVQSDGKVVAAGQGSVIFAPVGSLMVMRLGLDGSPDPTFSGDGFAGTNVLAITQMTAVAVQVMPDGKILVAAQAYGGSSLNFRTIPALARFLADGTPDASFGPEGIRLVDYDPARSSYVAAMLVLPDGRIVLGGNTDNSQGAGDYFFLRTDAAGTLDNTFGVAGSARIDFGTTSDELIGLVRLPDGKLLAIGQSTVSGTRARIGILRLLAGGQLDTAVDGGKLRVGYGSRDIVRSVTQQADGKVLIAGTTNADSGFDDALGFVGRLTTTGAADLTFGSQGRVIRGQPIFAVAAQADGRVYFAGKEGQLDFPDDAGRGFVQAVRSDGSADPDFAPSGRTSLDFGTANRWSSFQPRALLRTSDGRLTVLADVKQNEVQVARLVASGGYAGVIGFSRNETTHDTRWPERSAQIEYLVQRTGGSSGSVSVSYAAAGPVAIAGRDFVATSGTLTWGDGETAAKRLQLPVIDDNDYETADEVINMTLSSPTGGAVLGTSQVSNETTSDELGVQLVSFGGRFLESEGTASIRVERRGDTRIRTTVDYRITDGGAVAGVNYTATPSGTLTWEANDSTDKFITLALINNPGNTGGTVHIAYSNASVGTSFLVDDYVDVDIIDDDGPQGTSWAGRTFYHVSESAGSVSISIGRPGGDPAQGATLDLVAQSFNSFVASGVDFGAASPTHFVWAVGDYSRRTLTIPILQDSHFETTECFDLNSVAGGTAAIICILDDEPDPGIAGASFAQAEYHVSENVGTARLQVNRIGDCSRQLRVAVNYGSILAQSLSPPNDFPGPPNQPIYSSVLVWEPDDATPKFVEFPITDDALPEPDESVELGLSMYYPYEAYPIRSTQPVARLVVDNDDGPFTPRVGFTQSAVSVSEDAEYVDLPVMLTGTGADAIVSYSLHAGSTADFGSEFVLRPDAGSYWFHEPTSIQFGETLRVWLNGDNRSEGDETFTIDLAGRDGYMPVGTSSVTVTLVSNDVTTPPLPMQVGFATTTISQAETSTAVNLTVSRTGPITSALSVHYETQAGTALAGTDFTAATGDVQWAAGDGADKTITLNLVDDSTVESAETMTVKLTAPTNGATLSADTATITITSEDVAPPPAGGGSSGGGGGGGGRLDAALLLFALTMAWLAGVRRRQLGSLGRWR